MRKIEANDKLYIGAEISPKCLKAEDKDRKEYWEKNNIKMIVTGIYPRIVTLKSSDDKDKKTYSLNLGDLVTAKYLSEV